MQPMLAAANGATMQHEANRVRLMLSLTGRKVQHAGRI